MSTKEILYELRTKNGLSQDELAEKVFVTRQAVSRWENGDTVPNTETLMLLSKLFDVSINTLLGSPRELICQCCGMPMDDGIIGKDKDTLVFYEVKYRSSDYMGSPKEAINTHKIHKICRVSDFYRLINKIDENTKIRFDVISIKVEEIEWIKNAFEYI